MANESYWWFMWLRFMCLWSQTGDISNSQVTIFAPHSNRSKGVNRCHFPQAINLASVVSPCHHLCVGIPLASIGETYFCEDGAEDWFFCGKKGLLFSRVNMILESSWIKQVNEVTSHLSVMPSLRTTWSSSSPLQVPWATSPHSAYDRAGLYATPHQLV